MRNAIISAKRKNAARRLGAALASAAVLLCACKPIEEQAPEQIYYIEASEPMERFYIPDTEPPVTEVPETETFTAEAAETVETAETAVPEITETETETETETAAETETETVTETETEATTAETAPVTEATFVETAVVSDTEYTEAEAVTTAEEDYNLRKGSFSADDFYVKPMGRTFMKNGVRILSHTCSGVEFAFRGTSADITLTSNCKTSKARAAIYVNGELFKDTMLKNAEETFHVFDSDTPKNCIVSVVKLSEAAYSNIGVKSIDVISEYGIIPTPEKPRKIEFIGDSITCGYGVDASDQYEAFSTTNENGGKTYAALIGKYFNADYNIVSWSGIGVYSSYTETSKPNRSFLMPAAYGKTAASEMANDMWDFTSWQPDVVVINLGTNDNTWTKGVEERVDTFGSAYYDFIVQVRKANPNAYIICSLGVMGSKLLPEIEEQVKRYTANTGDYRITTFEFDYRDGTADGFGAGFHPSAKTHRKMAEKMIPFISNIMGW